MWEKLIANKSQQERTVSPNDFYPTSNAIRTPADDQFDIGLSTFINSHKKTLKYIFPNCVILHKLY